MVGKYSFTKNNDSTMSENDFEWQVKTLRYHENLRISDSLYTAKAFTDYKSVYIDMCEFSCKIYFRAYPDFLNFPLISLMQRCGN